jgi:hypothetical protein
MGEEYKKRMDEKIDQFIQEKRYDEAAILITHMALISINPQDLVDLLMKAIREFKEKEKKPNPKKLPFYCFPCGKYIADLEQHNALKSHIKNSRRWRTEMGYRKKWSRCP